MATSTERVRVHRRASGRCSRRLQRHGPALLAAVEACVAALSLAPEFAAVGALALRCAAAIDKAQDRTAALAWLGVPLLKALKQLGAPAAA